MEILKGMAVAVHIFYHVFYGTIILWGKNKTERLSFWLLFTVEILAAFSFIPIWQALRFSQCLKFSEKGCRSSCLESQITNLKLKKNQQNVPGPPPKLYASDWRTCGNFQHWFQCSFLNQLKGEYSVKCNKLLWLIWIQTIKWTCIPDKTGGRYGNFIAVLSSAVFQLSYHAGHNYNIYCNIYWTFPPDTSQTNSFTRHISDLWMN